MVRLLITPIIFLFAAFVAASTTIEAVSYARKT